MAKQEYTILPFGTANLKKVMCIGVELHHNLKNIIKKKYGKDATNMEDGSVLTTNILKNKKAALKNETKITTYTHKVVIGMDMTALEFFQAGKSVIWASDCLITQVGISHLTN